MTFGIKGSVFICFNSNRTAPSLDFVIILLHVLHTSTDSRSGSDTIIVRIAGSFASDMIA